MRFFATLLITASLATAALAAPHAISVGEVSVRRAAAAGFLAGTQVGEGLPTFILFQVIYLITISRAFGLQ